MKTTSENIPNKNAKNITNPRDIGCGVWYLIHLKAKLATTPERKDEFVDFMETLTENFSCMECRVHMKMYIKANPIRTYFNMKDKEGKQIGCFKWGWLFHNAVNKRIHREGITYETAIDMYYGQDSICTSACDGVGDDNIKETTAIIKEQQEALDEITRVSSKTKNNRKVEVLKVVPKKSIIIQR